MSSSAVVEEEDAERRSTGLLSAVAREIGATVWLGCWPLTLRHPLPDAKPALRPPVVLVHGYMAHAELLRPLARRLLEDGFPVVERVSFSSWTADLDAIVDRIAAVAIPLAERHGHVDLVGHSLGGFASRAWIKARGGAPFVRRFVTLGTPHRGTSLYRLAMPRLRSALDPAGDWVRRLSTGDEPVHTTVIRARYDHQVLPHARGTIPGTRDIVLDGLGHNGLLSAKEAHDAVVAALTA